jgi:tetratricopeptide (TPR) repeat protein
MCARIIQFVLLVCAALIIQLFLTSCANTPANPSAALEMSSLEREKTSIKDSKLDQAKVNIISLIQQGKYEQAQVQTQELTDDFSGHPDLPQTFYQIARKYEEVKKYDKAIELYQYNIGHFPDALHTMWSQVEIIKYYLDVSNNQAADTSCDKLLAIFSKQPTLPKEIFQLARQYNKVGKPDKALVLDQYNTQNFPTDVFGMWSQVNCLVQQKDYIAADAAVDKILAAFPEAQATQEGVYWLTDVYRKAKRHDKAVLLYKYYIEHWPDDEKEIYIHKGLALSYIDLGDEKNAQAEISNLLAEDPNQERISKALYDVGLYCYRLGMKDKAAELHHHNVQHCSKDDKHTMWSQVALIKSYIRDSNDRSVAEAVINKLITDFAQQPTLSIEISHIGDTYAQVGAYDEASQLYQYVFNHWTNSTQILWAKAGMIKLDISHGNEDAMQKTIDSLIVNYKNSSDLPEAIWSIGEQYWAQALSELGKAGHGKDLNENTSEYFKKALAVWERIIRELPPSIITAQAYHMSAECYRYLGQEEKAIEYYQKVVDNWPEYQYAWHTQFLIALLFDELEDSGRISQKEAAIQITRACERLLSDYPDCRAVNAARDLLVRWSSTEIEE